MGILEIIKTLMLPTATAVLTTGVCVFLLLKHLERWRRDMLTALVNEVRRDLSGSGLELKGPVSVRPEDGFVTKSVCDLHHRQFDSRMGDLTGRVERLERKLDQDITRLHERVDELPSRMVEVLKPLLKQ